MSAQSKGQKRRELTSASLLDNVSDELFLNSAFPNPRGARSELPMPGKWLGSRDQQFEE
jgi:hypothetical protein